MSDDELVVALRRIAQNEVGTEVERRETTGLAPMTAEDREVMARSILKRELKAQWQAATQRGAMTLTTRDEETVTEAVLASMFSALPGLDDYLTRPDVTDIFLNGCDDVRLRLMSGDEVRVGPIASSDDELVTLIQGLAAGAAAWVPVARRWGACRAATRSVASARPTRSWTCTCRTGRGWRRRRG